MNLMVQEGVKLAFCLLFLDPEQLLLLAPPSPGLAELEERLRVMGLGGDTKEELVKKYNPCSRSSSFVPRRHSPVKRA